MNTSTRQDTAALRAPAGDAPDGSHESLRDEVVPEAAGQPDAGAGSEAVAVAGFRGWRRHRIPAGIGLAAALLVGVSAALLGPGAPQPGPELPSVAGEQDRAPDSTRLSADELLSLALTAEGEGRLDDARGMLESGVGQLAADDRLLRWRYLDRLADVCESLGRHSEAALYRGDASRLAGAEGDAAGLYRAGTRAVDEGRPGEGRRLLSAFLLRSGELGEEGRSLEADARVAIARSWYAEWEQVIAEPADRLTTDDFIGGRP